MRAFSQFTQGSKLDITAAGIAGACIQHVTVLADGQAGFVYRFRNPYSYCRLVFFNIGLVAFTHFSEQTTLAYWPG